MPSRQSGWGHPVFGRGLTATVDKSHNLLLPSEARECCPQPASSHLFNYHRGSLTEVAAMFWSCSESTLIDPKIPLLNLRGSLVPNRLNVSYASHSSLQALRWVSLCEKSKAACQRFATNFWPDMKLEHDKDGCMKLTATKNILMDSSSHRKSVRLIQNGNSANRSVRRKC